MKITAFEWDEQNEWHIFRHNVIPQEVEEVCRDSRVIYRKEGGRYIFFGQTAGGRYLTVILEHKGYGLVRVITARDMDKKERRYYQSRR